MPTWTPDCRILPIRYGEKRMCIDARDMAWHTAPQNVRTCDTTATIRPSKSGHKTTHCDAHSVAVSTIGRLNDEVHL